MNPLPQFAVPGGENVVTALTSSAKIVAAGAAPNALRVRNTDRRAFIGSLVYQSVSSARL